MAAVGARIADQLVLLIELLGEIAVSYTHLDVYKRQMLRRSANPSVSRSHNWRGVSPSRWRSPSSTCKTVSYTHLDVYKRQPVRCWIGIMMAWKM